MIHLTHLIQNTKMDLKNSVEMNDGKIAANLRKLSLVTGKQLVILGTIAMNTY